MISDQLLTASRVLIVAGKGGVGKTTVSATLAVQAARHGLRVLLCELEGRPTIPHLFGVDALGYEPTRIYEARGFVEARTLSADDALIDYLQSHGMRRISNRMARTGVIDIVSTATPGLRDLLILGKVKQIEGQGTHDLIVVDAPASGHAISFLRSPRGVLDAVSSGALHTQASEILEMLSDAQRCSVVLVTLAEETPVSELIETAYQLEEDIGLMLGPVVCNGWSPAPRAVVEAVEQDALAAITAALDPPERLTLESAGRFCVARGQVQIEALERLGNELPLPQVRLPFVFSEPLRLADIEFLASQIELIPPLTTAAERPEAPNVLADPPADNQVLERLIRESRVLILSGSGGVGKTTTAAVIAIRAAELGRRVALVTIDPARRLADALGIDALSNDPKEIHGPFSGTVRAMMLDTKATFDALIEQYAPTPEQRDRIVGNAFYRNISTNLSGTQEYMAAEKLFELHRNPDFDIVIVDTPPTRNALDFLDAPDRIARFLGHPLFRIVTAPTRGIVRAVNAASRPVLRALSNVVGGDVITDAIEFFQAFEGMEAGFRDRAVAVRELLAADHTNYIVVTAPLTDSLEEAEYFVGQLNDNGLGVSALIVNRMHPSFVDESSDTTPDDLEHLADADRSLAADAETRGEEPLSALYACRGGFRRIAGVQRAVLRRSGSPLADLTQLYLPYLSTDVHDMQTLVQLAQQFRTAPEKSTAGPGA